MSTTPFGPPAPDGASHPGPGGTVPQPGGVVPPPGGTAPPPGTTAPDGSVWNGSFWEAPPGGPTAPGIEDLRAAAPVVSPEKSPSRSAFSDMLGTTLGSVVMVVAAAIAAWLFITFAPPSVDPAAQATASALAGGVVGVAALGVQRAVVDWRSWYVSRTRGYPAGAVLRLDLMQWLLMVLPPLVLAAVGAVMSDRVLAMTGAVCASLVGIALMGYAPSECLTRRPRRRDATSAEDPASRSLRWARFWLMALFGLAAGAAHLLVPPPVGPVAGILVGSIALAAAVAIALPIMRWWEQLGRPGPGTRPSRR